MLFNRSVLVGLWKIESRYGTRRNLNNGNNPKQVSQWWRDLKQACVENEDENWFDE